MSSLAVMSSRSELEGSVNVVMCGRRLLAESCLRLRLCLPVAARRGRPVSVDEEDWELIMSVERRYRLEIRPLFCSANDCTIVVLPLLGTALWGGASRIVSSLGSCVGSCVGSFSATVFGWFIIACTC